MPVCDDTRGNVSVSPRLEQLRMALRKSFPFNSDHVERGLATFGVGWAAELEELLERMFQTEGSVELAAKGYCAFVLDGMRLMKRFEKTGEYVAKTYAEAASEVYNNREYMFNLYLPGNLLSHYLWPHHYRQLVFVRNSFIADMRASASPSFFDVGIGTGFYSRVLLNEVPGARGIGFDVSEFSIDYTRRQVDAYQCGDRYELRRQDVTAQPVGVVAPFVVCVEVLEHLEDPLAMLRTLRSLVAPGGKALITAALTAPNADHIYLYRNAEEVHQQLREVGFRLEQYFAAAAYVPRANEPVPTIAAFIVT